MDVLAFIKARLKHEQTKPALSAATKIKQALPTAHANKPAA
jgi:hypothetical protein